MGKKRILISVILLASTIIVMGILQYYYRFNLTVLFEPSWLSVIASLVLAFLTAVYVLQTQNMLREMTETRKAEFLPHVKAGLKYLSGKAVFLLIENVGKGAAINVDLTYGFRPSSNPFIQWIYPLFVPNEKYSFLIKPTNFDELAKRYDSLIVRGTCEDIFGQKHEIDEKINLKETHKGWSESMMILEPSLEDRLKDIGEEVKKVGQEIEDTTRDRSTFPVSMKLGNLEIKQPPLQSVLIHMGGIDFAGRTLNKQIYTQLKRFREGDVEEVYCNDHNGVILSGVYDIKKTVLEKEKVGQKVAYSFSVSLARSKGQAENRA